MFVKTVNEDVLEVNRWKDGTSFRFNKPYTKPSNLNLTYSIVSPAGFTFDEVKTDGDYVYLIIKDAAGIDGEVDFTIKAQVNTSFYVYVD